MKRTHAAAQLLALGLLWSALSSAPAAGSDDAFIADTRAYLSRLERLGFSGVVTVARHDTVLVAQGYGLADRENGRRWTPETVSTVGSITKQFTAAAILKLEEAGKLRVEDPLSKYVPGVPADKAGITLHHLLTHTSGIEDDYSYGDFDPVDREKMREVVLAQPLHAPPGEHYAYSNAGFSLLGMVVERVSGQSYETFLKEQLFTPAGMTETGYRCGWPADRLAQGYRGGERWGTVLERPWDTDGPYWTLRANGGIHSTCGDMRRWVKALLADRVLTAASREKLWTPFADEGGGESYYGYGWVVMEGPGGHRIITHNGGNGIFFADLGIVPDLGLVVFLQTNVIADFPQANRLLQEIGFRYLGGAAYPTVPDVIEASPEALAARAGIYALASGSSVKAEPGANRLVLTPAGADAWSALYTPAGEDSVYRSRNERIDAIVEALLHGDVGPLHEAYGGRVERDVLETRARAALAELETEIGPGIRHEVLGSAPLEDGTATFVRITGDKGSRYRQYVWSEEGTLRGYRPLDALALPSFFPVGADRFRAWGARLAVSTEIGFDRGALVIGEGDRAIRLPPSGGR